MRGGILAITVVLVSAFSFGSLAEENAELSFISLKKAEELSVSNSHLVMSQEHIVSSASETAAAERVKQLPKLDFDASSKFSSKIGKIEVPTLGISQTVGEHTNWGVGPTLNWIVWDTGSIAKKAKGLSKTTDSESENLENDRRQVLLNGRSAYIAVGLAKERLKLVQEALKLARSQYAVVLDKKNTGTADLFDLTVAHQEVTDRERDLEDAKGELAVQKRALVAALGYDAMEMRPDEIDVENIGTTLSQLLPKANDSVDIGAHPQVKSLDLQSQSSTFAAKSISAKHWPSVVLQGRSTYEYPNLGASDIIQQNTLSLGLNLPIIDWGILNKQTRSQKLKARAATEQKNQTVVDLSRNESEVRENIQTRTNLRPINTRAVKDAVAVAKLSFDSFSAGRIIFLDVQRANVKALSVKVQAADNDAMLSMWIAKLLALAGE